MCLIIELCQHVSIQNFICRVSSGREEGVFLYSVDDRGGAAGFEGEVLIDSAICFFVQANFYKLYQTYFYYLIDLCDNLQAKSNA